MTSCSATKRSQSTSGRKALRDIGQPAERDLLKRFLWPYAEALADLVDERLQATGRVVVVDLHSYQLKTLPYERHQDARRPPVCVGVDVDHKTAALVERVSAACSIIGQDLSGQRPAADRTGSRRPGGSLSRGDRER